MTTQKVNAVGSSTSTASTQAANSQNRAFPSDKVLKKIAQQLGMSVEELKKSLVQSKVPANRKSIYGLVDTNKMDMKVFCELNGIDYSKWRDYKAGANEVFYVIQKPKTQSSPKTLQKSAKTPAKPVAKPQVLSPASKNKRAYGSSYTPSELANKIFELSGKYSGAVGKPDFDALINEINPKNASAVIKAYTQNPKNKSESLINTITSEIRSDKQKRKAAVMKVYDALAKEKGTPASVRDGFVKELNEQFDSWGMVSTKKLDETIARMMATPEQLASKMAYCVDHTTSAVGKPDFNELLALVTPKNASQVVKAYDKLNTKESLLEAITSEVGSSKDDRKAAVMHIYDAVAKQKGAPASKREAFVKELEAQFDSWGMVSTKKLDAMLNGIINTSQAAKTAPTQKTQTPSAPKAKSKAEQLRNSTVAAARKDIENRFYNSIVDKRTGVTYPSFREQLVEQIKNNPKLSDAEKTAQIARAKKATVDVSTISRPIPQLDANGNIKKTAEVEELAPTAKSNGKVVIINEGHGGYNSSAFDAGAYSYYEKPKGSNKYYPFEEYQTVKPYSKDLSDKLRAQGYTVVRVAGAVETMSANKTIETLSAKYGKKFGAGNAMFVSLHCDAGGSTVTGSDVCYDPFDLKDKELADIMHKSLNSQDWIKAKSTPRYNKNKTDCGLYVLRSCKNIPSVLLEIEYLTGTRSLNVTSQNYRNQFVGATYDAIEEYFRTR